MSSRMRKPETVMLNITRGDWLLVKKHLTAGEEQDMYASMIGQNGSVAPVKVGTSTMIAYLMDWSITDADDKPIVIREKPEAFVLSALRALDADDYKEIQRAIDDHVAAMDAEREKEKNVRDGALGLSPGSPSASDSVGATTGLTNLTPMSIAS